MSGTWDMGGRVNRPLDSQILYHTLPRDVCFKTHMLAMLELVTNQQNLIEVTKMVESD